MWDMIWPLLLIVGSSCLYNICTKAVPEGNNTFGILTITYMVGAVFSAIFFVASKKTTYPTTEIIKISRISFALGLAIVGLEVGYVFLYRNGWKISDGALTAHICTAIALLIIGFLFYKETLSFREIIGIIVCGIGLLLINGH